MKVEPSSPVACAPDDHAKRSARPGTREPRAFDRAASIFRAAGDVARLQLLERLAHGEWCVSELAEAAGVGLSTVSQQLRLLRAEHLVTRRRSGKHVYYVLADKHVANLIHAALEHALEEHATVHDDDDE
jgi:ArsR family transcriptional regulator